MKPKAKPLYELLPTPPKVQLAVGSSRFATKWQNKAMDWGDFVGRLSTTYRTQETVAQYHRMSKARQGEVKDVGGFVGGVLRKGRRKAANVANRSLLSLDLDYVVGSAEDFWDTIVKAFPKMEIIVYSSHSHTEEAPRLRLLLPFTRPVTPDEYEAVGRKIAEMVGIDQFDDSTYQAVRLMYWPSTPEDGEYVFYHQVGGWLSPDAVLELYDDWRDVTQWPMSSREIHLVAHLASKQEDPTTKEGPIGAFCIAYPISLALETFLKAEYAPTRVEGRYTYTLGSSVGGLVTYEDKWAYSHHGTDPCHGQLVNSFDLVRLHRYGKEDEATPPDRAVTKLPSYKSMLEWITKDPKVQEILQRRREEALEQEFDFEVVEEEFELEKALTYLKSGEVAPTIQNIKLILEHDPKLKGKFTYDEFSNRAYINSPPWRSEGLYDWSDVDEAGLRLFLEVGYNIGAAAKINDAFSLVFEANKVHPVREYLKSLVWDGIPRLATMLPEYLGAENSEYVREVSRIHMTAAVARIMEPGVKYDNMLTLTGPQGLGKSTLIRLLGKNQWYSDNMDSLKGKEAAELVQGHWLIEMGELNATRKSDRDAVKSFLSRNVDVYRVAYARNTTRFPRQCVFWGTTNEGQFLRDPTGDRRTFPVRCAVERPELNVFTDLESQVDQIWAEAVWLYTHDQPLYLSGELARAAREKQRQFREENPMEGIILAYLNRKYPEDWDTMNLYERRDYIASDRDEGKLKDKVCVAEILCECMGYNPGKFKRMDSREVNDILRGLSGWIESTPMTFSIYGNQRCFKKIES